MVYGGGGSSLCGRGTATGDGAAGGALGGGALGLGPPPTAPAPLMAAGDGPPAARGAGFGLNVGATAVVGGAGVPPPVFAVVALGNISMVSSMLLVIRI